MYYDHMAQSSVLQGVYCCQSLINLSEITCGGKVKKYLQDVALGGGF